jgi:hypothetical protein
VINGFRKLGKESPLLRGIEDCLHLVLKQLVSKVMKECGIPKMQSINRQPLSWTWSIIFPPFSFWEGLHPKKKKDLSRERRRIWEDCLPAQSWQTSEGQSSWLFDENRISWTHLCHIMNVFGQQSILSLSSDQGTAIAQRFPGGRAQGWFDVRSVIVWDSKSTRSVRISWDMIRIPKSRENG